MHWAVYWPEERNDIFEQATIVARGVEKVNMTNKLGSRGTPIVNDAFSAIFSC